ncbi:protein ALP1-like isoform X1 [Harpegnathos saltator]|uniref:protein ALP1-like isoform X1 n=1 Tax=Harpegnathos saltator TaxID=610380 RepID=UPI000DBEEB5A|nr:protein ALP1-like isoform X1 [Harpegnathos saltator]
MDPLEDFLIGFNILIMNEINENLLPLAVIRDLFVKDNGNDDEIENIAINAVIEMAEGIIQRRRRTCITNYIEQIVPMYTDEEFIMHYRLKRMLFRSMVDRFSYWAHFRNLGGSIDGSHIRIDKPSEDPVAYINRKHYFSIHMQGTVNEQNKFLDVLIGYPGSVHDARVFANSSLAEDLPALCHNRNIILGDAAYPCLPQLITPYRDNGHLTQAQRNFNRIHSQCKISVEHTFGVLKQRFRELYFLKLRNMQFIIKFIFACCVLHNMADFNDMQYMEEPEDDNHADVNAQVLLCPARR